MNKSISFIFILLVLFSFSCKTSKKTTFEKKPMPDWVLRKPQSQIFYTGISSASKSGFSPSEYIQSAQQRALGDLASSISVNIESSSMLSIIESNYQISENFSRDIIASTSKELEEYELVDVWEDENNYWVYYRLSRDKYHQFRQQKKNKAIQDAKNKLNQADVMLQRNLHYNALQFMADALADIKIYLGESTITEIDGKEIDLGNHIFTNIISFLNDLKIEYPHPEIKIKRGVEIAPELISFTVMDKNNNPISNMPFRVGFSGSGLLRNLETSGSDGKIVCAIRRISSSKNVENITISVDMQSLSRITGDPMIRNILRNVPVPEKSVRVFIEKPKLFVNSTEMELNKVRSLSQLKDAMEGNLGRDFEIVDNRNAADYFVSIESNTAIKGTYVNEHYVTITCRINMTDKNGNNLFRRTIENDHMGPDFSSAAQNAYNATARSIERSIVREITTAIN